MTDKAIWDQRYRDRARSSTGLPQPAAVLSCNQHLLPPAGVALDLACGLGGNALLLAQAGLEVHAWDVSDVAVDELTAVAASAGLAIIAEQRDVLEQPPAPSRFDVIVVSRFLDRALMPILSTALRSHGLLFYQTFTRKKVDTGGPSNPHFLLAENELLRLCAGLIVRLYREEGQLGDTDLGLRNEALIVAQKP